MEYQPIDVNLFPPKLRDALKNPNHPNIPKLESFQVYQRLVKS